MLQATRQQLFQEVQHLFQKTYPYLSIDRRTGEKYSPSRGLIEGQQARTLLFDDIGLNDDTTVAELEIALQQWFGFPVEVLRKSGNTWMKTRFTRLWSLRDQNEQGRIITADMTKDVR